MTSDTPNMEQTQGQRRTWAVMQGTFQSREIVTDSETRSAAGKQVKSLLYTKFPQMSPHWIKYLNEKKWSRKSKYGKTQMNIYVSLGCERTFKEGTRGKGTEGERLINDIEMLRFAAKIQF